MICPNCKQEFEPTREEIAKHFGALTSPQKAKSSAANGKLGGRPPMKKSSAKKNRKRNG